MTKLTRDNSITRETATWIRRRPLVIELHPDYMILRTKGTREKYSIPYDSVFWSAVKKSVDLWRAEKRTLSQLKRQPWG